MKKILLLVILFCFGFSAKSQNDQCSVTDTDKPNYVRPYVGNNQFLMGVLKEHGIYLPADYLENLDSEGLYRGRNLEMKDLQKPSDYDSSQNKNSGNARVNVFPGTGTVYYLPVKIHNYANSSGTPAFSNQQIYDYFAENFKAFRTHVGSIEFYIKSISVYNNSAFYNLDSDSERNSMYNANYDSNALNIHLVSTAPAAGSANRPGNKMYVANIGSDKTTLPHELGHNFSLKHTHGNGYNATEGNCSQEPVSRYILQGVGCLNYNNAKKCETNGDGFCDTPGDPNLGEGNSGNVVNSSCNLVIGNHNYPTDNWGATWVTDPKNLMSYSPIKSCRTKFSYSQAAAMFYELQTSQFSFKSTSANYTISGPTLLCPNTTYTFTAPSLSGVTSYRWQVPVGWNFVGQGTNTITVTVPSWAPGNHQIYLNAFPAGNLGSIAPKVVTFNNSQISISGPSTVADDSYCRSFYVDNLPGLTYYWYTSAPSGSGVTICYGQNSSLVTVSASSGAPSFYLNVSTPGLCGIPANGSKYITVSSGGGGPITKMSLNEEALFYPNPVTSNQVNFKIPETVDADILNVTITNSTDGNRVMYLECWRSTDTIDVSTLKSGVYAITYILEGKIRNAKLIIQ